MHAKEPEGEFFVMLPNGVLRGNPESSNFLISAFRTKLDNGYLNTNKRLLHCSFALHHNSSSSFPGKAPLF
jgi:hypothetical protein